MNAFSFDLAVGGRDLGAIAHKCPHSWKERIDITRRVKAGIGSFRLSRSARDLLKEYIKVRRKRLRNMTVLRLTMSIAVGALARRDHITGATRGQGIRVL
jgi:hypothetical protein